jgi:nucleoside-diphosphate-sugar epimerase
MHIMAEPTVILFGATSYLGHYVLRELRGRGFTIIAPTRNPEIASILLGEPGPEVTVCRLNDMPKTRTVEAVVNLSYVKKALPDQLLRRNVELVDRIVAETHRHRAPRLIHVSSVAVFGYSFDRPPRPGPAPGRTGDSYIELKTVSERRIIERARTGTTLAVVRPGNILGAASPTWVANVAQRMLEGAPVGIEGRDGYCNGTSALNLAHYLSDLVCADTDELQRFGLYHHVAEMSAIRWRQLHAAFSKVLGVQATYAPVGATESADNMSATVAKRVVAAYLGWAGAVGRRVLRHVKVGDLMEGAFFELKARLAAGSLIQHGDLNPKDRAFLTIVSAEVEFQSHTLASWSPPLGTESSIRDMTDWLATSGYSLVGAIGADVRS